MEKKLQQKLEALQKQAQGNGKVTHSTRRNRSSLSQIIKTKEQADRFMKLLKSA
ncbi:MULTISPECIES: hypothetical protein [Flaviaestuariibacter]|uniref:50S ribosomal protein L29 n=1 Tax=Flaviaesturariibacter amylovorans TaxID=1084520 RepID=A0ABP8HLK0_9BACT|nr:hypothetical protein [Flaviaesturariibacter flavus]